jgi:hypothetical protein
LCFETLPVIFLLLLSQALEKLVTIADSHSFIELAEQEERYMRLHSGEHSCFEQGPEGTALLVPSISRQKLATMAFNLLLS